MSQVGRTDAAAPAEPLNGEGVPMLEGGEPGEITGVKGKVHLSSCTPAERGGGEVECLGVSICGEKKKNI